MQIFPLDHTVTDQWFYFPMIGMLGMIGVIIQAFHIKFTGKITVAIIAILIIVLSIRTFIRSFDWRDDFTLASHDVTVSKEAYSLEHELSRIYIDRGEYQLAKVHAERSIQIFPYVFNYTDLGNAYFSLGNYPEAKKAYQQALKYGDNYTTYENLSALYINYGDPKEGVHFIKNLLERKYPSDARLWLYLGVLEYRLGNKDDAKTAIQHAYQFDPGIPGIKLIYTTISNNQPLHYQIGK
jgi:tetratricopeptide (TPR) repeat protein